MKAYPETGIVLLVLSPTMFQACDVRKHWIFVTCLSILNMDRSNCSKYSLGMLPKVTHCHSFTFSTDFSVLKTSVTAILIFLSQIGKLAPTISVFYPMWIPSGGNQTHRLRTIGKGYAQLFCFLDT